MRDKWHEKPYEDPFYNDVPWEIIRDDQGRVICVNEIHEESEQHGNYDYD